MTTCLRPIFLFLLVALTTLALSQHPPSVPQHEHAGAQGIAAAAEGAAGFGIAPADANCAPSASCWATLNRSALHPSTPASGYGLPVSEQLPANVAIAPPDQPPRFPL